MRLARGPWKSRTRLKQVTMRTSRAHQILATTLR